MRDRMLVLRLCHATVPAALILMMALVPFARAASPQDDLDQKRNRAIEKAIAYLKTQQATDGSWTYENLHPRLHSYPMLQGSTALGALALVKSGVPQSDPAVTKALTFVLAQPIEHTYSAGLVLLLLDALAHQDAPAEASSGTAAKPKAKLGQRELELGKNAVEFLEKTQQRSLWRYPSHRGGEDSSNAQYALLGLDAAERLGLVVSRDCYMKAQAFFVDYQEKDGPEVEPFAVPGADMSIGELKTIERELGQRLDKIRKSFVGKKPGELDAAGHDRDDLVRVAEQDAAKKIYRTGERERLPRMRARGFPYAPSDTPDEDKRIIGSMTASGVCCLFVCKTHLDGTPGWKPIEANVNQAIRDGMAWLAKNWTVEQNPHAAWHQDYFLYSLERAAILTLAPRVGTHDWYREGSIELLRQQRADGSFFAENRTTVGPVVDTCFGLLFLSRAATPVVKLPERVVTGGSP